MGGGIIAQTFWNAFTGLSDWWLWMIIPVVWIAAIILISRHLDKRNAEIQKRRQGKAKA